MRKYYFLSITLVLGISLQAQSIKLPVGKKFTIHSETNMTTRASAMGQDVEVGSNVSNTYDYEIKKITDNGFTITTALKHMKVTASVMGQEQVINSDDSASRNDPQYGEAFAAMNKPYEIEIENKKAIYKGDIAEKLSQMGGIPGIANDQSKLILTKDELVKMKQGNQWRDSLHADSSSVVMYEYTVLKATGTIAEVLVKATMQINLAITQMGMEIKQSLNGTSNGTRQYDIINGLLLKEDSNITINGTMDVMGQSSPISMTGKMMITVSQ